MQINRLRGEINIKLVYCGPPYSGKTTNLERLHALVDPSRRSELTSMKNQEDRTLFFDYMQIEMARIGGLVPRVNLYTVPGQPIYEATRQIVLRGADAIVFVADSARDQLSENQRAWHQLKTHLAHLALDHKTFPLIVQCNKRDLPDALPLTTIAEALELNGEMQIEAIALQDVGVRETVKAALRAVLK